MIYTPYNHSMPGAPWLLRLRAWLNRHKLPPHLQRAVDLVAAVDKGGIPLNPMRVNHIARELGLEVSPQAPLHETIERIRQALRDV